MSSSVAVAVILPFSAPCVASHEIDSPLRMTLIFLGHFTSVFVPVFLVMNSPIADSFSMLPRMSKVTAPFSFWVIDTVAFEPSSSSPAHSNLSPAFISLSAGQVSVLNFTPSFS